MYYKWDKSRAESHIDRLADEVQEVSIKDYTRDKSLNNIKVNEAYAMDAVHLYVDVLNLQGILTTENETESENTHKRAIRFFDSHVRAIKYILARTDSLFVDFHNQRLHAVITKPYDSEVDRIHKAVAIADLIIESVAQKRDIDGDTAIEPAEIRVGIDSGLALAVNNGRRSNREPLFLGDPANHAAKHACGEKTGIYLTNNARSVIGLAEATDSKKVKLLSDEIETSKDAADLEVTCENVINELKHNDKKLKDFSFSRTTPPLKDLDFADLYYKSTKHQEIVSIYADIDGFTNFVSANMGTDEGKANIIRALHIIRSEMDATLNCDYKGRRVRFIGDCLHGLICEGSHVATDMNKSVDVATEAVGGIRSSFNMCLDKIDELFTIEGLSELGLAIGYEIGDVSLTRVGKRNDTSRYAIGMSTIKSEDAQKVCKGNATKIGDTALTYLNDKYEALFSNQIAIDLTYASIKQIEEDAEAKDNIQKHSLYDSTPHLKTELKAHAKNR